MPTSFKKNLRFSPKPEKQIAEFSFDGGLVTDKHKTKLKSNQSFDEANIVFNDTSSIKTKNGYLRYNTDPVGSSSDEANTGASTGTVTLAAEGDRVAQTFQVSALASIVQCDFYLEMDTSGEEQYVQAQLWTGATGPSALVSLGQILLVSGAAETKYSFRFRVPYSLAATTEYAVVLRPYVRGSSSAVNDVLVHRTGNSYANGAAYNSTDSGLNWSAIASVDLKFNVFTGGDTGCTGLIRYYGLGEQQLFGKFGTTLYRGNDITGAMTAIVLGSGVSLTAGNFLDWTISNDTLLVVDGANKIQKYRGSTNANYTTGTLTATNASATVTGSGTSWNTITNAIAGEYIKLPDGKWYKITAIASDTSLTIERTYQGSTLAGQTYTISPWGEVQGKLNSSVAPSGLVRPLPSFIENHINRIWTLEGNTLRFSALDTSITEEHFNDFDTGSNAGAIIIPSGRGDTGTGLYSLSNSLYVFQKRAIWRVYGNSPANFELRNVTNEVGMLSKRTLVEWNDLLIFLSDQGVILFDGSNVKNISDKIINTTINSWANKTSPVATLWDNRYVISNSSSGSQYNDEAYVYDLSANIWGKIEGAYTSAWSNWIGGTDTGQIYFGSSNQGSIYRWDVGGHDDGYEIETRYNTAALGFDSPPNDKTLKKFYIQQLALGDWSMSVGINLDISSSQDASSDISLSAGNEALWDVAEWDVDTFPDESSLITTRVTEFQGNAKYFSFEFTQSGYNEGVEILGMTLTGRVRRLN